MRSGVTRKALVVGISLILLNSFWTIQHHEKFYASWSIFYNVSFILFMLTLLNFALKHLHPKVVFSQGEMLTIYVMLCLATSVGAKDTIRALPPIMRVLSISPRPKMSGKSYSGTTFPNGLRSRIGT